MAEKYCCVIDAARKYITYVLVLVDDQGVETVQNYTLKEDELLIDAKPPVMRTSTATDGYLVPVWDMDTSTWTEGATAEELAAWYELHPDWLETDGIARICYKLVSIIRDEEGNETGRQEGSAVIITTMMAQYDSNLALAQAEAWPGSVTVERVPEDERPPAAPPSNEELAAENKLLKEQVAALSDQNDFQEELIVELANIVYA